MHWRILCLILLPSSVHLAWGHGQLLKPSTWHDTNGDTGMKATLAGGTNIAGCWPPLPGVDTPDKYPPCVAHWFTNGTHVPGEPVLPPHLRTYMDYEFAPGHGKVDWTRTNPWRAPGTARVDSPCGVLGGNPQGCPRGNPSHEGCPPGSWGRGPDARSVHFPNVVTTEWAQGTVVEAAWGITANHGGGYSYRLCKRPQHGGNMLLEEDCFRKTVLDFVGDKQWVQFGADESSRFEFKAQRTTKGTFPAGSMWTKNPIPSWNCPSGGHAGHQFDGIPGQNHGCTGPQFPPPREDLFGFGYHVGGSEKFPWSVVDKLQVPADLALGEYVLSWRWDCEQTPQVWTTCANVRVVGAKAEETGERRDEAETAGGHGQGNGWAKGLGDSERQSGLAGPGEAATGSGLVRPGEDALTCNICSEEGHLRRERQAGVHEGVPYTCEAAQAWLRTDEGLPHCGSLVPNYRPMCCSTHASVSPSCTLCPNSRLMAERIAGYHEAVPYTCKEAQDFLHTSEGRGRCSDLVVYWDRTCCHGSSRPIHRRLDGGGAIFV